MADSNALEGLTEALRRLPGVGVKSAARMAFHLLQNDKPGAMQIAKAIEHAVLSVKHCALCNTLTEQDICNTCQNPQRDRSKLCVVETPADQAALERTLAYQGLYYVLMGRLAPLEGTGPDELDFDRVLARASDGVVQEVILATNFTAEGETTAHYLSEALRTHGIKVTRLARGVPAGSEIEYVDAGTVAWALMERKPT